jgi:hypothetical protein
MLTQNLTNRDGTGIYTRDGIMTLVHFEKRVRIGFPRGGLKSSDVLVSTPLPDNYQPRVAHRNHVATPRENLVFAYRNPRFIARQGR